MEMATRRTEPRSSLQRTPHCVAVVLYADQKDVIHVTCMMAKWSSKVTLHWSPDLFSTRSGSYAGAGLHKLQQLEPTVDLSFLS
jgi:hypothetical protein